MRPPSCVYIMSVPSGHQKIGIADNPVGRLAELQTGNPEPITLMWAGDVGADGVNARDMERDMHRMLAPCQTQGEWFKVPVEIVYHIFKIAWVRARAPRIIARWERLCLRPIFVARYSMSKIKIDAPWRKRKRDEDG